MTGYVSARDPGRVEQLHGPFGHVAEALFVSAAAFQPRRRPMDSRPFSIVPSRRAVAVRTG